MRDWKLSLNLNIPLAALCAGIYTSSWSAGLAVLFALYALADKS